ncbi:MAG: YggS family pyridoxal phosphate-dependent enzyme [Promethearchaeota archaeon]
MASPLGNADPDLSQKIGRNLEDIRRHLSQATTLIAVSKKKPTSAVRAAYNFGQRYFGENYIQDAIPKIQELRDLSDIKWHFIGHLQSNKAKLAAQYFDVIQTVDSKKIARKLNEACQPLSKKLSILIEINIGNEPQKGGITQANLHELLEFVSSLSNLTLQGFMAIPPADVDPIPFFTEMRTIFDQYRQEYHLKELSMGMSGDYQVAILHGATMVRLGTKIFGSR